MTRDEIIAILTEIKRTTLYTVTMLEQMKQLTEWEQNDPDDETNINGMFFSMVSTCFYRVILLECYKLVYFNEYQNLYQFLNQLSQYYENVKPVENDGEIIEKDEYVGMIRDQKKELDSLKETVDNIKEIRNNLIAHSDESYYLIKNRINQDFLLTWSDIDKLLSLVKSIIRIHYSLITGADPDMSRIHSPHNARLYLSRLRAMERFWRNDHIDNIRKTAFFSEDYEPKNVFIDSKK